MMRFRPIIGAWLILASALIQLSVMPRAQAQAAFGSAFSYQGQLRSNGNPLTAACDFQFKLYDAYTSGNQVGTTQTLSKIQVRNGLFNVELNFGDGAFSSVRYLEVGVAYPAGSGKFTKLTPRQKITPAPMALIAGKVASAGITSASLARGAVTEAKLADGAVTDAKISGVKWSKITGAPQALPPSGSAGGALSGDYPNPQLAPAAVNTGILAPGAVTAEKLAAAAVTAGKLADASVTNAALAENSVTSRALAANAVTSVAIAPGAVTADKILGVDWLKITGAPSALPPSGPAGGDLAGAYPAPLIARGAVTNDKIQSLDWNKITNAPSALPPAGLAGGALAGSYPKPSLALASVTSRTLADHAVTSRALAAMAVTDEKIKTVSWAKITSSPATMPPSGAAGGDLAGTYPAPLIANGAVTTPKLAEGAVTDQKILSLAYAKLTGAPAALPPSGPAGGALAGNYPNPLLAASGVTSLALANDAVTSRAISPAAVTNDKIQSVSWTKITGVPTCLPPSGTAAGDLSGFYPAPTIIDSAITTAKLAAAAVTSRTLAESAVTSAALADRSVTGPKLADGAVTSRTLAPQAVTNEKILSLEWAKITGAPAALPPSGDAGGALAGAYPNPTLASGAVDTAALGNGAVTDAKIASIAWSKITGAPASLPPSGSAGGALAGAYPNPALATGAVDTPALGNGAVSAAKIAYGAVTSAKLATGAVGTSALADSAVTDAKIASVAWSKVTGAPSGTPPIGSAGGDLAGIYPDPTLGAGVVTADKLADGAVTSAKLALPLALTGTTADVDDALFTITDLGQGRAIDAISYATHAGIRGQGLGLNSWGLFGLANNGDMATGVGGEAVTGYGVTGRNMSTSNYGHLGTMAEGVYGNALREDAHGVTGVCDAGTSATGVYGSTATGRGVWGVNTASANYGVLGSATYGVLGSSDGGAGVLGLTSTGVAVYGRASGAGAAAVFEGKVEIKGSLECTGSKNFKIDHPLDPEHKYLVHAAVEGPERMNIYSGNVVTDARGVATITLPAYFESINTDFRYQLTPIGQFAQAIIAEKIKNNRFTIRTDKPNVEISWQVIGTRNDAYAKAHPFAAEEAKGK